MQIHFRIRWIILDFLITGMADIDGGRITEDGEQRITEDGDFRVVE